MQTEIIEVEHEQDSTVENSTSERAATPIAELVVREDFPHGLMGENVDIADYKGVIVEISNRSIRVRSQEGPTRTFNIAVLKKLYGPAVRPEFEDYPPKAAPLPEPEAAKVEPKPVMLEPDFSKPVRPISELAGKSDFPQCALGEHVDIAGYTGVVVAIVKQSLKVRSEAGTSRSFNAELLAKLHGGK